MPPTLIAVRTRLSEHTPRDLRGVEALAGALGELEAVAIDDDVVLRPPHGWSAVLDACRQPLRRTGEAVTAVLRADGFPLTLATDCALAIATLPAVRRAAPAARVLWLDAHYDFCDPGPDDDFLGSMALSGACGRWSTGFSPAVPPAHVVLVGARSRAGADPAAVTAAGVTVLGPRRAEEAAHDLAGHDVYVHLDPDVLDPSAYAGEYPEPGGLGLDELGALLRRVAEKARIVGAEATAFHAPEAPAERDALARRLADVLRPLW